MRKNSSLWPKLFFFSFVEFCYKLSETCMSLWQLSGIWFWLWTYQCLIHTRTHTSTNTHLCMCFSLLHPPPLSSLQSVLKLNQEVAQQWRADPPMCHPSPHNASCQSRWLMRSWLHHWLSNGQLGTWRWGWRGGREGINSDGARQKRQK